jgi:hypothetical protein
VIDARVKITIAIGTLLGVAAVGVVLSHSPIAVAGINTAQHNLISSTYDKTSACQSNETLPRETSAIRLRVYDFTGPRVTVAVLAHGHVVASGERESGWTGGVVTVPVKGLSTSRSGVQLCFTLYLGGDEVTQFVGEPTRGAHAARVSEGSLPGRVRVEYLRPSSSSWWSLVPEVARRMGLGHAGSGTWSVLLVAVLMGSVAVAGSRLVFRELG